MHFLTWSKPLQDSLFVWCFYRNINSNLSYQNSGGRVYKRISSPNIPLYSSPRYSPLCLTICSAAMHTLHKLCWLTEHPWQTLTGEWNISRATMFAWEENFDHLRPSTGLLTFFMLTVTGIQLKFFPLIFKWSRWEYIISERWNFLNVMYY